MKLYLLIIIIIEILIQILNNRIMAQLMGGEKTMEQFLDRLLHESVYDRRVRPFYKSGRGTFLNFFKV
jgi:hypothetical protein